MKKLFMILATVAVLTCMFAISVSAAVVENYEDTFTLNSEVSVTHYEKWSYNDGKSFVRKKYTDTMSISFIDENGEALTEVPMWEYDEEEGKYYSLVWYISDYELSWEDQTYTDANVGDQTYPKYTSAVYTLSSVRAVDLRYYTHQYGTKYDAIESWKESRTLKSLEGIYYDINNTPDDTTDDLKLQDAVGIGRDTDNYGYYGYEAQWAATGDKIVVANFRDCDFQRDVEGNYGTANTWSSAYHLQCLWYPDTMLYISAGIGPVYEVDFGEGMEIIACQILRDNKRVKNIRIPNSVLYINNEAFRGSDLTSIVIGEGLINHGDDPFLWTGAADNYYLSKNIVSDTYKGKVYKLLSSNTGVNIYFDGDLAQAEALAAKLIAENSNYNGKINVVDYKVQAERDGLKNLVIFYNYNRCEAFYENQHNGSEVIDKDSVAGYLGDVKLCVLCERCNESTEKVNFGKLFVDYGYSATEEAINGTYAMSQFYGINKTAIEQYRAATGKSFEFGFVVSANANPFEAVENGTLTSDKIFVTEERFFALDYASISVNGIADTNMKTAITFCMFVKDGDDTFYLDGGETVETVTMKSYNDIFAMTNVNDKGEE